MCMCTCNDAVSLATHGNKGKEFAPYQSKRKEFALYQSVWHMICVYMYVVYVHVYFMFIYMYMFLTCWTTASFQSDQSPIPSIPLH